VLISGFTIPCEARIEPYINSKGVRESGIDRPMVCRKPHFCSRLPSTLGKTWRCVEDGLREGKASIPSGIWWGSQNGIWLNPPENFAICNFWFLTVMLLIGT
jgi:hypothetical protein